MRRQDDFSKICSNCKSVCCKGARPPLTLERIQIISSILFSAGGMESLSLRRWYCRGEYVFPRENSRGCVFLDDRNTCMIHSFKPETCVAGPITFDINFKKRVIVWYLKKEEICPLAGALYHDKDKLKRHLESAKKEIKTLVRQLPKEELLAILKIEEPETFKIGEDSLGY